MIIDVFLAACILIAAGFFVAAFAVLVADPEELRHDF
jgi:hypothetical protein